MRSGNVSGKTKLLINAFLILTIVTCLITMTNISLSISLSKNDAIVAKEDIKATTEATEEQADLTTEVVVTRGGAVVYNDDVVHEGEYLKYNIRVKNTTEEDIDNVVLVATIPEGVKYGELQADFSKITYPYEYIFSEDLTEKIIEIESIKAGETKDLYYEVKVKDLEEGETSKQITTEINSYKGEELIQKFEMTNTIEPAEIKLFLGACEDYGGSTYGLNIFSKDKEEVEVKIHFPKSVKIATINEIVGEIENFDRFRPGGGGETQTVYENPEWVPSAQNILNIEISENNIVTTKLKTNRRYNFYVRYVSEILADEFDGKETILTTYVETENGKYVSNENRIERYLENIDISMTSPNANGKVKYDEEIEYNLTIENNGTKNAGEIEQFDFLQVKLLDYLPEDLKPVSVTYDTWKMIEKEEDGVTSLSELRKTEVTEDISRIAIDKEGNKLANVNLLINIPRNEISNITIKVKAGMVYEETLVENSAIAMGEKISDKVSEKISHTILPYDYVDPENPDDPIDPVDPVDPIDPVEPIEPVEPVEPSTPVTPTNPANPSNPGTSFGSNEQTGNGTCDFKIDKYISKVTVRTASGTKQYDYNDEKLVKTEIKAKELNGATVTVDYKIVVTNVGQVAGTITRVVDKLPSGFAITSESNKSWPRDAKGEYANTSKSNLRIEPGESSTLNISATKQMTSETVGNFINEAEIRAAMSISGASETNAENNSSSAELIIAVSTGAYVYITIAILAVAIFMVIAVILYKKGKINIKKIKGISLILLITAVLIMPLQTFAYREYTNFYYKYYHPDGSPVEGSREWIGGPGEEGGYCLEADNLAKQGLAKMPNATEEPNCYEWYNAEELVESRDRVTVSNNQNEKIGMRVNGGNLIYGPFRYSSNNVNRFLVYIKDANGKSIDYWSTCDANGNGLDLQDGNDNGNNKEFYITGPKSIWANGISKIELQGNGTRTDVYEAKRWGHAWYRMQNLELQLVQANQQEYRGVRKREEDVDEYSKVTWTQFNGSLEIEKVDADNARVKLPNVVFQITGPNGYNQTHTTDENGRIIIENITPGTYTARETSIPHYGYNATVTANITVKSGQLVTSTIQNPKQTGNLRIHKQDTDNGKALGGFSFKISNSKGEYIIAKTGANKTEQKEVRQKIQLTDQGTTTDPNAATTFITDSNGNIEIYNMLIDTYRIIETSVGNNIYYEVDANYISWTSNRGSGNGNTATVQVVRQSSVNTSNTSNNSVNLITIKNRQKYVDLSGYVWDDTPADDGKETGRNGIYRANDDDADRLLKDVTVNLKEGNTVIRSMDTQVGNAVISSGEHTYKFERVEIDQLDKYYIEFVYNGMSYEGVELKGLTQWNTSKAAEGSARQTFNNKFKVITNNNANGDAGDIRLLYDGIIDNRSDLNYEITNSNKAYGYEGAIYPINYVASKYLINATTYNAYNGNLDKVKSPADIRKDGTTEIQNINLGVYQREQPDISIKKDIKNVKILVNGKGQIYEYDKRFSHMNESAGDGYDYGVKFGNKYGSMKYTRPIYKADVMFRSNDENRELQVYLTYAIGIKNNSSNLSAQINQIVDFYDKRYAENSYGAEIKVGTSLDENTATVGDEINFRNLGNDYAVNSNNRDTIANVKNDYNKLEIDTTSLGRIEKQSFKIIYVQFKLSRELVYEILGEEGTTQEPLDNVTEITSYSIFDANGAVYAGIDQNSNPGNAVPGDKDTYEADTDAAPSLRLEYNAERVITGNVFEDLPLEELLADGVRQGNGQLDAGEPGIPKVKVELLRKEARENGSYGDWVVKSEYTTTTDSYGAYTIKDFAAGDYVIRYTWGGKEHIVDVDKEYTAQNYKATIYNDEVHNGEKWYQSLEPRYSDATDTYDDADKDKLISGSIADTRESIDRDLSDPNEIKHGTQADTNKVMVSETPEMAIDVEYNPTEIYNPGAENRPSEPQVPGEEDTFGGRRQHQMQNLDFGIIERPRQNYELLKKISHVKVTLSNGQVLIDADIDENYNIIPTETSSLTSFGPTNVGAPGYANGNVKIEMDSEILQGSTLQITYELSVRNTSEVDYANKLFYTYGTTRRGTAVTQRPVTITVKQITDYLDKEWAVNENEEAYSKYGWDKKTRDDIRSDISDQVYNGRETKINDRIILQTEYLRNQAIARADTSEPVRLVATKVLTTINNNDVELDNEAEITRITKTGGGLLTIEDPNDPTKTTTITPGNYVPGTGYKVETEPDDDMAQTVTVTPNTGDNMNFILPIAIGIGALAILGVGIIVIKKALWGSEKIFK